MSNVSCDMKSALHGLEAIGALSSGCILSEWAFINRIGHLLSHALLIDLSSESVGEYNTKRMSNHVYMDWIGVW